MNKVLEKVEKKEKDESEVGNKNRSYLYNFFVNI